MHRKRIALLGLVAAVAVYTADALGQSSIIERQEAMFRRNVGSPEQQRAQFPPHKIVGNLYYVGSQSLASFLIATPQGHILINTNWEDGVRVARRILTPRRYQPPPPPPPPPPPEEPPPPPPDDEPGGLTDELMALFSPLLSRLVVLANFDEFQRPSYQDGLYDLASGLFIDASSLANFSDHC